MTPLQVVGVIKKAREWAREELVGSCAGFTTTVVCGSAHITLSDHNPLVTIGTRLTDCSNLQSHWDKIYPHHVLEGFSADFSHIGKSVVLFALIKDLTQAEAVAMWNSKGDKSNLGFNLKTGPGAHMVLGTNMEMEKRAEAALEKDSIKAAVEALEVVDLDAMAWSSIKAAIKESNWIPEEYGLNDTCADLEEFIKFGAVGGGIVSRSWIDQPSTHHPLHKMHGQNVIAIAFGKRLRAYPVSGSTISLEVKREWLSEGWTGVGPTDPDGFEGPRVPFVLMDHVSSVASLYINESVKDGVLSLDHWEGVQTSEFARLLSSLSAAGTFNCGYHNVANIAEFFFHAQRMAAERHLVLHEDRLALHTDEVLKAVRKVMRLSNFSGIKAEKLRKRSDWGLFVECISAELESQCLPMLEFGETRASLVVDQVYTPSSTSVEISGMVNPPSSSNTNKPLEIKFQAVECSIDAFDRLFAGEGVRYEGLPPIGAKALINGGNPHRRYRAHIGRPVTIIAHNTGSDNQPTAVYKVGTAVGSEYHALVEAAFERWWME